MASLTPNYPTNAKLEIEWAVEYYLIRSWGYIKDNLRHNVALRVSVFRLFRALDLVKATVKKPNSQRFVMVNDKKNLSVLSDKKCIMCLCGSKLKQEQLLDT